MKSRVNYMEKNGESQFYLNNPQLPNCKYECTWTPDQVKHLNKCKNDVVYFAENFFTIVNLDRGKELIKLYKVQKRILKSLAKNKRVVLLASRQIGKTTLITIFALWFTIFQKDKTILIVANREKTAIEILGRVRLGFEYLPNWLKPGVKDYAKTNMVFCNDSRIFVSTTAASAGRTSSINCLLIDEAAHIEIHKEKQFFTSVLPTISSSADSKVFMISTANGTGNYFYKVFSGAEAHENEWSAEKVRWDEIPRKDPVEFKKQALSDLAGDMRQFEQEYENKFIESGESAIDGEFLKELKNSARTPDILNTPEYKVWEKPDPKCIYAIGIDVSDGVGSAASVMQGFNFTDLTNIKQAFIYHNRFLDTTNFAKEIFNIAKQWGNPYLLIERNAMGGEVIQALSSSPYNYERIVSYSSDQEIDYEKRGIFNSTNVKYTGVSNMRYWMNTLRAVSVYDIGTVQELETFTKRPNGTWGKQGGNNVYDDRVMAMIWCLFALHLPVAENIFEILQYDEHGKPLKIAKGYYDDDKFYGINQYRNDWGDDAFVPAFIGTKSQIGANSEMEDMLTDGWNLWNTPN